MCGYYLITVVFRVTSDTFSAEPKFDNNLIAEVAISVTRLWGPGTGVLCKLLCVKRLGNITVPGTH